jgi:hypothetical protein
MSTIPNFCKTPLIVALSGVCVSNKPRYECFTLAGFWIVTPYIVLLDTNILKEHAASIFRTRSDPVGGSMFLCKTGICDAQQLTLCR